MEWHALSTTKKCYLHVKKECHMLHLPFFSWHFDILIICSCLKSKSTDETITKWAPRFCFGKKAEGWAWRNITTHILIDRLTIYDISHWKMCSCNICIVRIQAFGIKVGLSLFKLIHADVKYDHMPNGHMLKLTHFC
jgi:hypothetical protein